MGRAVVAAFVTVSVLAGGAGASEHLVSSAQVAARFDEARAAREASLGELRALLATPRARDAAARMGADLGRADAALASLDPAELSDLAARARALRVDPAAGFDRDIHDLLVLFLIIAIVILVLQAVD